MKQNLHVFMTEEQNEDVVATKKVKEMKPKGNWNDFGLKPTRAFIWSSLALPWHRFIVLLY